MKQIPIAIFGILLAASCTDSNDKVENETSSSGNNYGLASSTEVIVTSEQGDKMAVKDNVSFTDGVPKGTIISVHPDIQKQTLTGIGSSFTESSAFVLAHLDEETRGKVMADIYSDSGANFSLARTVVGATDFAVTGKYSYAPVADDVELAHFSIVVDDDGFQKSEYPGIQDEAFDLLPMIREALAIKAAQDDQAFNIVASAWTAPPWMKDIEDWYVGGSPDNNWQGTGGSLKKEHEATYADYLVKYLDAYRAEGIDIWGMTPVNEPHGNAGSWESMHFSPESQRDFIRDHLGPKLKASAHPDTRILNYDQNRDQVEHWTDVVLGDPDASQYTYGTGVHWYASTNRVFEETLNRLHDKFPDFDIINTEATIDNLGVAAPTGITDPEGFEESGWFGNDAFWWNATATDWAYSATWAPNADDHPIYTPVHRYARNIIVSLNNWMSGWIDWNVVLDSQGGPNHVGNFCGAPIMIDTETGQVYYTPVYYVLAQFSRTIRPGDIAVQANMLLDGLADDDLHASASISDSGLLSIQVLNTTKQPIDYNLQVGAQFAEATIPANAIQTVRIQLD